jgi:hypothetical protein
MVLPEASAADENGRVSSTTSLAGDAIAFNCTEPLRRTRRRRLCRNAQLCVTINPNELAA